MLRFSVFCNGKPAEKVDLSSAYLVGSEHVPLRADVEYKDGAIVCTKRTAGPAALALVWPVEGMGRLLLETTRLPEREAPYVLSVELLRGHLMRVHQKREEWGLFDCRDLEGLSADLAKACDLLIQALQAKSDQEASQLAEQALPLSARIGEELSRYQAEVLLNRRRETAGFTRRVFGCQIGLANPTEMCAEFIADAFDFVTVPVSWKQIEPSEQNYNFKRLDAWVDSLAKQRIPIKGSSLISFDERHVPDWLYIWEHDFDTIRELVTEHVTRVVNRYSPYVQAWDVISGIHAIQGFSFNFEQLIELTRLAATVTKQIAPQAVTVIDVIAPWGEYYARNQRTIPPLLYMEMALQTGINFDACGLQFCFGIGADGLYVRDMLQISAILDKFGGFGKPVHITAAQVPSGTDPDKLDAWGGTLSVKSGGAWHGEWSEEVQSQWIQEFCRIALSKPFVDTIIWRDLSDQSAHHLPYGGLLRADQTPKPAYEKFVALRREIVPRAQH